VTPALGTTVEGNDGQWVRAAKIPCPLLICPLSRQHRTGQRAGQGNGGQWIWNDADYTIVWQPDTREWQWQPYEWTVSQKAYKGDYPRVLEVSITDTAKDLTFDPLFINVNYNNPHYWQECGDKGVHGN